MPAVDVLDSTWLPARAAVVGTLVADPASWRRWWPGLELVVTERRGPLGVRWDVRGVAEHPGLAGTAELYLQEQGDGVVAHFFLRLDPTPGGGIEPRAVESLRTRYRHLTKQALWALADRLDPGRFERHTTVRSDR